MECSFTALPQLSTFSRSGRLFSLPLVSPAARTSARLGSLFLLSSFLTSPTVLIAQTATPAPCVDCHNKVTPNIVADWKLSNHSNVEVTCVTCHGDQHTSATDIAKVKIPTPDTCSQCHETQVAQF